MSDAFWLKLFLHMTFSVCDSSTLVSCHFIFASFSYSVKHLCLKWDICFIVRRQWKQWHKHNAYISCRQTPSGKCEMAHRKAGELQNHFQIKIFSFCHFCLVCCSFSLFCSFLTAVFFFSGICVFSFRFVRIHFFASHNLHIFSYTPAFVLH